MKVLVTGATGFVGRALVPRLLADGHEVVVQSRSVERARSALGADVAVVSTRDDWSAVLDGVEGIINLAGEPIISGRWTGKKKRALVKSRVDRTEKMVDAFVGTKIPPRVLVSASAVGYYGDRGDEVVDEYSPRGDGFLAKLCEDWERAASGAERFGVRVATIRIGVVLGRGGGALYKMLPPFQMGAGGRLGSGKQYMPWIHIADLVELLVAALTDERYVGAYDGTAPEPVTNERFTKALGSALGRPTVLPVPALALKVGFGKASQVLLQGQRALPRRTLENGFEFQFESIDDALFDVVEDEKGVTFSDPSDVPDSQYLEGRPVHRVLEQRTWLEAPIETVYDYFSKPQNLGAMTPMTMAFDIQTEGAIPMEPGTIIDYEIRLGPVPMKWRTRIDEVVPMERFVDTQLKGPYATWYHEHHFEAHGERTCMVDRVHFAAPMGPLGRIAERVFIEPQLRGIFGYRAQLTALRFRAPRNGATRAA